MNKINRLKRQFLNFVLCKDITIFDTNLSENDWEVIVKWCVDHRIIYLFIKNLKQTNHWASLRHNQYIQYLEKRAHKAPVRQLKIQANLLHLDTILTANGIEYQIIKGPILAFKYYEDSAIRRMRDIDIIVKPDTFVKTCNLLLEHNYRLKSKEQKIDFDARLKVSHDAPPLTHDNFNISIEVHHRTFSPRKKQSEMDLSFMPEFWAEVDKIKIGNQSLPCESAEILLAHIILHGVRSSAFNNGPVLISDLYFLIKNGQINWKKFRSYSTYLKLENEANLVFSLLQDFYPDLKLEERFVPCKDDKLIEACHSLMLSDPSQKRYERLTSSLKSGTLHEALIQLKKLLLPKRELITAHLGVSSHPAFIRLPVWWGYILKTLYFQCLGRNSDLQTSEELTRLFRWLNR